VNHAKPTYIAIVFQKDFEIRILGESGMRSQAAQKDLMHCNGFLERRQILPKSKGINR
jgi:hypothetical protein